MMGGCPLFEGAPGEEELEQPQEEEEEVPEEIEEIEMASLEIMEEADLVVLLPEEEEGEDEEGGGEEQEEGNETNQEDEEEESNNQSGDEPDYEETILGEVLSREMEGMEEEEEPEKEEEMPRERQEAWENIKQKVTEIHDQWDDLEPQLKEEGLLEEEINAFEEALEDLTARAAEQDRFATLVQTNKLTDPLADFLVPFYEEPLPEAHQMKYYVRSTVLNSAVEEYNEARNILDEIQERKLEVAGALENAENEEGEQMAEELDTSIENLEGALKKEDPGLVKIKASLLMEGIVEIMEELEELEEEGEENEENNEEEEEEEEEAENI